jgi:hypothetical protein
VKLTFLSPVYSERAPFASVYVDTSRDIDEPDRAIELRWRHLKEDLQSQGADPATVEALAHVVGTDKDVPLSHGQAVFATHGRVLLAEELPEPPARDSARLSTLPDAMPMAVQHFPDIPYIAVDARPMTEPGRPVSEQDVEVEFQVGRWPATRVAGHDREARHVRAGEWRQGLARIADELTRAADDSSAELIVLGGDTSARGVLAHKLPKRLRGRIAGVESHGPPTPSGRALLEEELRHVFRGRMTVDDRARVDRFLAHRAHDGRAAEGLMAVVDALRRGQVDSLLVNDPLDLPMHLWVGTAPKQIGLSEAEAQAYGAEASWDEPADAALIRAVVGTRAELIVVPREELTLADGLGALLRYPDVEL